MKDRFLIDTSAWIESFKKSGNKRLQQEIIKILITVPPVDLIISSIAKVYTYTLMHHDSHFKLIAKHLGLPTIDFLSE